MLVPILVSLVALYVALYVILYVAAPFKKEHIPKVLPKEFAPQVAQLQKQSNTKFEYVKNTYNLIMSQNRGGRFKTLLRGGLYERDLRKIYLKTGYMHANQLNVFFKILCAQSTFFTSDAIRSKRTFLNFLPHEYVQVRIAGQWYDVDLYGGSMGVPLGKHASGFR